MDNKYINVIKRTACEIWTRAMGYCRPIDNFNKGKKSEFYERKYFTEKQINEINKVFYNTLDYFINLQGLSRSRVCVMLGRSNSTLNRSKKQSKKITWISLGLLLEILELLNVSPIHFFEVMSGELRKLEKEKK